MKNLNLLIYSLSFLLVFSTCKKEEMEVDSFTHTVSDKTIFQLTDEDEAIADAAYINEFLFLLTRDVSFLGNKIYKIDRNSGEILWKWQGSAGERNASFNMIFSKTHITLCSSNSKFQFIDMETGNLAYETQNSNILVSTNAQKSYPIMFNEKVYFGKRVNNASVAMSFSPQTNKYDTLIKAPCPNNSCGVDLIKIVSSNGLNFIAAVTHIDDQQLNLRTTSIWTAPLNGFSTAQQIVLNVDKLYGGKLRSIVYDEEIVLAFSKGSVASINVSEQSNLSWQSSFSTFGIGQSDYFGFKNNSQNIFIESLITIFKISKQGMVEEFYKGGNFGFNNFSVSDHYVAVNESGGQLILDANNATPLAEYNTLPAATWQFSFDDRVLLLSRTNVKLLTIAPKS